jgi:hypothetical protein
MARQSAKRVPPSVLCSMYNIGDGEVVDGGADAVDVIGGGVAGGSAKQGFILCLSTDRPRIAAGQTFLGVSHNHLASTKS